VYEDARVEHRIVRFSLPLSPTHCEHYEMILTILLMRFQESDPDITSLTLTQVYQKGRSSIDTSVTDTERLQMYHDALTIVKNNPTDPPDWWV
jgi:hypothetical protein